MGSTFKDKLGPDGAGLAPGPVRRLLPLPARARRIRACGIACAEVARKQVKIATAGAVAAVIVEPMQGTAGNIIPPKEFLPAVRVDRRRARRAAHRRRDDHRPRPHRHAAGASTTPACVPDIVTIGKAFGGGFPLSALADHRRDRAGASRGRTRRARRRATAATRSRAAAGAAALRIIDEENLVENSQRVGARDAARARDLRRSLPVRRLRRAARACSCAIELVSDKQTQGAAAAQGHRAHLQRVRARAACSR